MSPTTPQAGRQLRRPAQWLGTSGMHRVLELAAGLGIGAQRIVPRQQLALRGTGREWMPCEFRA